MTAALLACASAIAGNVNWAHQNGSVNSNGSITVKSLSGGSYVATQNPSGAVAKASQNAATQPPTVIIQATSNFACYYLIKSGIELHGLGTILGGKFNGLVGPTTMAFGFLSSRWRYPPGYNEQYEGGDIYIKAAANGEGNYALYKASPYDVWLVHDLPYDSATMNGGPC